MHLLDLLSLGKSLWTSVNGDVAERLLWSGSILSLDLRATRNSAFVPESFLFPLAGDVLVERFLCQPCKSAWDPSADSILILLPLLRAITRVFEQKWEYFTLPSFLKCLRLYWLLASIYKEGSRFGKLLGLSFHGYSQPALCHYWPTFSWASSQICDMNQAFLCITPYTLRSLHITPLNHTLFSTRLISSQGINIRQHNSIIQQPNSNPTLNAKRDFRASQRWAARKLKGRWVRGFECFT